MTPQQKVPKIRVGWREWLAMPQLGISAIKAKVDTGARTSALHAFYLDPYRRSGIWRIRFGIHPLQRRKDIEVHCDAAIVDHRAVSDSGGHREERYVIKTLLKAGEGEWPIELTLTNRDPMLFRMLLGRSAMRGKILVNPQTSYRLGRFKTSALLRLYKDKMEKRKGAS